MTIENLRKKINNIDSKILELLNERAKIVKDIGKIKKRKNLNFFSPVREKQIITKLTKENKGPLLPLSVKNIFKEILSGCRVLEKQIKIAYLGPQGTFTHIATIKKFGGSTETIAYNSIADVFDEVEKNTCDYGVVPIENSTEGVVNYTLDMFLNSNLSICAEIYLNISHHLLSKYSISEITKIYSNQQAFSQCKIWLRNNISSKVELIETSSTTKATEIAKNTPKSASIASELSSSIYDIPIIAENIQDDPQNKTRFLVIGKNFPEKSGKDKTSLMFSVKHQPGALYKALSPLDKFKVNMTMIESRPTRQKIWEYVFFIDVQGYFEDENLKSAIQEMEKQCFFVKILGSYPEEEG